MKAPHGQKTVVIKVRLFTNGLGKATDEIEPKHVWSRGDVALPANKAHGIKSNPNPIMFNSLDEIPAAIAAVLEREGVTVHGGIRGKSRVSRLSDFGRTFDPTFWWQRY